MSLFELILLAFSLSLDAAVLAVGAGALVRLSVPQALRIAAVFGLFHTVMPVVGWLGGMALRDYLLAYGNIVGGILLMIVGGKMLYEATRKEDTKSERNILKTSTLLVLAVVTSLDVLIVGFSFSFIEVNIPLAVLVIGGITFLVSLLGVYVGGKSKHLIGTKVEILGALVLILLGLKTLLF